MSKPTNEDVLQFANKLDRDKGKTGILLIPVKFLIYGSKTNTLHHEREQTIRQPLYEGVLALIRMKALVDGIPFDEAIMIFVKAITQMELAKEYACLPDARVEVRQNGKITWVAQ